MKTNSPTHDAISQRARQIWESEGNPIDRDTEIWLSAERQLSTPASDQKPGTSAASRPPAPARPSDSPADTAARIKAETASESAIEYLISPSNSDEYAVRAALQTSESRGATRPAKTPPQLAAAAQVRGNGNAQSTSTPAADPKPGAVPPAHAPLHVLHTPTPAEVLAKTQQQKHEARAPQLSVKTAPNQTPPESGKPLWDRPHSS
jgi:hypothetical protein